MILVVSKFITFILFILKSEKGIKIVVTTSFDFPSLLLVSKEMFIYLSSPNIACGVFVRLDCVIVYFEVVL